MSDKKAKQGIELWMKGDGERGTTKSHWQECANNLQPDRNDYTAEKTPGQKRLQYIYDSHPMWCLDQFVAGCHSQITSSNVMWFWLRLEDERTDSIVRVRQWLEMASMAMYGVFNSPRYNFASQSAELYADVGNIGTACMAALEGRDGMPLFSTRHMKECVFFENEEDRVDTVVRRWTTWTARQAYQKWGEACGETVAKAAMDPKTAMRTFPFLHLVRPRSDRRPDRADAKNMVFESVYIGEADQCVISESGFREFPYMTPRFSKLSNEIYGRGRGMIALPDVKMLYEAKKLVIKAAQKIIDPPLDVPNDTYLLGVRTVPGSINYRPRNLRPDDGIRPIQTEANIPIGSDLIQQIKDAIGRVFYVDILRMPTDPDDPSSEGKGSTATYWAQRREKEFMAMSPFLARVRAELAGPLIDRTFAMLWRKSAALKFGPGSPFPPPPPELAGQKYRVEYVSPIELAQRASQDDVVDMILQTQLQMRQIDPQSPIVADFEAILRGKARRHNAPWDTLKSPEQMQQDAEQRQQAEEAMAQHAALANVAKAAKDGSAAVANLSNAGGAGAGNDNGQQAAA